MELNLTLSPELLDEMAREVEKEQQAGHLRLSPGSQEQLSIGGDFKTKLEKYIDFEAGGLKLLDLDIHGRPARFLLVPDIGKKTIWLQFQYRF